MAVGTRRPVEGPWKARKGVETDGQDVEDHPVKNRALNRTDKMEKMLEGGIRLWKINSMV